MCGSGRFLVPLLQAGVPIEGVDASAAMLAACRSSAEDLGLVPKLYEQSLEDLSLPQQYGLAFVPAGSLGLIHQRDALRACLRRLRQHLSQNAMLFIELVDVESFEPDSGGSGTRSANGSGGRSISYSWRSCSRSEPQDHSLRQPLSTDRIWQRARGGIRGACAEGVHAKRDSPRASSCGLFEARALCRQPTRCPGCARADARCTSAVCPAAALMPDLPSRGRHPAHAGFEMRLTVPRSRSRLPPAFPHVDS